MSEEDKEGMDVDESVASGESSGSQKTSTEVQSVSEWLKGVNPEHPAYQAMKLVDIKLSCLYQGTKDLESAEIAEQDLKELNGLKEKVDETLEKHYDENLFPVRVNFARLYRELRMIYVKVISRKRITDESTTEYECGARLPPTDVPKFNGNLEKWSSFKEQFGALIEDKRVRFNDSLKKRYLFQALSDEALAIVENMREGDFTVAWKLLCSFYDDPFRRGNAHYEALFKSKKRGLLPRQRLISYRQHTAGLRAAYEELNLDPFEQVVIAHYLNEQETKPSLRIAWERRITERKAESNLEDFFKFLETEVASVERAGSGVGARNSNSGGKKGHVLFQRASKPKRCEMCSGTTHYTNQCADFRKLTVDGRLNFIREKKLCMVCFQVTCKGASSHPGACFRKSLFCAKCKKPHNTLLHKYGESVPKYIFPNDVGNINTNAEVSPLKCSGNLSVLSDNLNESTMNEGIHNEMAKITTFTETSEIKVFPVCMLNEVISLLQSSRHVNPKESLFATVVLNLSSPGKQNVVEARALLDNASTYDFVTTDIVNKLNLETFSVDASASGLGSNVTPIKHCTDVFIRSQYKNYNRNVSCLVVDNIVNSFIPNQFIEIDSWNLPTNIHLADPHFNVPAEIDLLLGIDVFWQVLKGQSIKLKTGLPQLQATLFGWIVVGSIRTDSYKNQIVLLVQPSNDELLTQMQKFWTIESYPFDTMPLTRDETECERLFTATTYRREDGRFVVSLPFKQDPNSLGDSRADALRQFLQLEKRLMKNDQMRESYNACMSEYLSLGHMREITENSETPHYYLPHHAVINPTSTTTRQRTVFNASMKTSSGLSLNDILYTGPVVQPELISILIRFRLHKYVMSADIVKMYRQISINPEHASFQRIFWRDSFDKPLKVYELDTLSFGERPAPFLATRCLNELALKHGDDFPDAKPVILNDFYVDNLLTGSNSLEQTKGIQEQLITLLNSAGLPLSKWCSNDASLLTKIDKEHIETKFQVKFDDKEMVKTLGMYWIPSDDCFKIWFERPGVVDSKTKRQILSVIASIFDPMGLLGPVTVLAKCFMQEVWKQTVEALEVETSHVIPTKKKPKSIHWDDTVKDEILIPWKQFASQLIELNQIVIPRHIMLNSSEIRFELHGFSDASSKAYGAVIYSRVIDAASNVRVSLICSKSRVAPLKQLSIARLELCAANLLAELANKVASIFTVNTNVDCIRLWSDSKVALSWIGSPSYKWSVFVAHRVSKIQCYSENSQWDYVESAANPADLISRGMSPQELAANFEWFNGPSWLRDSAKPWTDSINFLPNQNEPEERKPNKGLTMALTPFKSNLFNLVSNPLTRSRSVEWAFKQGLSKLLRIVALIIRFRYNTLPYFPRAIGLLKEYELRKARTTLVKLAQTEHFSKEIACLKERKPLDKDSPIVSLNPRLDQNGVVIVGGRLSHSDMSFEQCHPALLHPSHKLTNLIIMHEHLTNLHANPRLLRSILRRRYWIIRINGAISKCLKTCQTCFRFAAQTQNEIMADLPKNRVVPSKPFTHTGVDYAGPVQYVARGGRHKILQKAYIAVFVCFATKAIHLELVSDMTASSFASALRRFVSRRGVPLHIYSDNGTTFVGANNELKQVYDMLKRWSDWIEKFAQDKGIQWHFIPPYSPHLGGIWEAGVKSVKSHLRKVIGSSHFNFEEYCTLLSQIEACLNSRPLTTESSDPNELNALTPGHFLIGGPITALPNPDITTIPDNRLKQWDMVTKMTQLFWKRWREEYLNTLQQRNKWRIQKNEVKVNDIVILKDDNLPPTQWRLGKITELHPGKDGLSRVVTLRTSAGYTTTKPKIDEEKEEKLKTD